MHYSPEPVEPFGLKSLLRHFVRRVVRLGMANWLMLQLALTLYVDLEVDIGLRDCLRKVMRFNYLKPASLFGRVIEI
jgi:hypothetical protein